MEQHEKGCTANPNRYCRMCKFADGNHAKMEDLISAAFKGLDELRRVAGNCPACMLAAIRGTWRVNPPDGDEFGWTVGGGHSSLSEFNFKEELQEFWKLRPRRSTDYN